MVRVQQRSEQPKIVTAPDTETGLIRPGCLAPPLVCVTWQDVDPATRALVGEACIMHVSDPRLYPMLKRWLEEAAAGTRILAGHNISFDMAVICERFPDLVELVFAAYDADGVVDTMIRQWLLDNAAGRLRFYVDEKGIGRTVTYDLERTVQRASGRRLQKDAWRLSYAEFLWVPMEEWPVRAVEVQHAARLLLPSREALLAALQQTPKSKQAKGTQRACTALSDEIKGLKEMLAGDPSRAREYPLEDAIATAEVWIAQEEHAAGYLADQYRQARAYFALYLQSAHGLRTDAEGVKLLRAAVQEEIDELLEDLIESGLVRPNGKKDTKAAKARMIAVCKANGMQVVRTDGHVDPEHPCPSQCSCGKEGRCRDMGRKAGHKDIFEDFDHPEFCTEHVGLGKDDCERIAEFDELLWSYSEYTTLGKVLTNDLEALAGGIVYPVHTRYGFAATGRTTSSRPNIQNQSKREGIREAFVARPGHVFIECDYPQLELYTLAQCCMSWFGYSKLGEVLRAGRDPHTMFAASILQITYEDAVAILADESHPKHSIVKKTRQQAKPGNFGFPGGMGAEKFLATTRKQLGRKAFAELGLDIDRARRLKKEWLIAWPETQPYFKRVEDLTKQSETGRATVETLFTGRIRGGATYCATANNGFQALGADCAKHAGWLIAKACYATPGGPLDGSRANAMVHDEFMGETRYRPDALGMDVAAHNAAHELARLMADGANAFLPDVPIAYERMEPVVMRRWYKAATSLYRDAAGEFHKKPGAGRILVPAKAIKDPGDPRKTHVVFDADAANPSMAVQVSA